MTTPDRPKIKLAGKLPTIDKNGLATVTPDMIDDPDKLHVAVVVLRTIGTEEDFRAGQLTVKAEIARIEVIGGDDLSAAKRLILRASEERAGKTMLPFDTEKEIEKVFAEFVEDGGLFSDDGGGDD